MVLDSSMTPIRIELPTEFAVGSVNAFLFPEPEPVLIDTGVKLEASWETLVSALAEHGLSVADVSRVVVTHPHVDHFGQAAKIAAGNDARVWVSELGREWLVDFPGMWRKRMAYYRDSFMPQVGFSEETVDAILDNMEAVIEVCESVPADRVVTFGLDDTLQLGGMPWEVVYTPGHASHQTCFYQRDTRQLLSADMLLTKAPTPIVERPLRSNQREPSLPRFLDSLALIESLEVDIVYPGHGAPFGDHRQLIRQQRERIRRRMEECLHLISEGHNTVADLVDRMYAHIPVRFRFAGLWMLVGYLDLLMADGLVKRCDQGGVWNFKRMED